MVYGLGMTNTHSTDHLAENYASAGYCHFPGCENRERVWMSDTHVALADGMCAMHSELKPHLHQCPAIGCGRLWKCHDGCTTPMLGALCLEHRWERVQMGTLDRLRAATEARTSATARWERLIRLARKEGHSLREVGDAAGVTHAAIAKKER